MKKYLFKSLSVSGLLSLSAAVFCLYSCNLLEPKNDPITYGETYIQYLVSTDKACYLPGEAVQLSLNNMPDAAIKVRYQHLGETIGEEDLNSKSWTWQPPTEDFQGYMAELHADIDGRDTVYAAVAIDVSSEPKRFPRNGFLSAYGSISENQMAAVMNDLNRYHINYVQFQDWHWKHHHPLGGTAVQPMDVWTDIISRNTYRSTVQGYIDAAHERGMKTLYYNLAYGALEDFETDGVSREWMLFIDTQHREQDVHPLTSPFKSSIYLTNSGDENWKDYLSARNNEVYQVFDFDGWQIDQLGVRTRLDEHKNIIFYPVYDYYGNEVDLAATFGEFVGYMKSHQPEEKRLVMNAVGQYGQQGQIASSPVDFCYTEVWEHSDDRGYDIFRQIISDNTEWSNGKQTVLAAYLNYNYGQKGRGWFNTPGIVMATAAATAWGGTILQMGEHMLCNEYFPGDNLSMSGELKRAMIAYYDFAVAYENLLRPEIPAAGINSDWFGVDVESVDGQVLFNQWAPVINQVATVGRHVGEKDVIHLLSYRNATHLDWCDTEANQGEPDLLTDLAVRVPLQGQPKKVWFASPDYLSGAAMELDYTLEESAIKVTLPALKYYDMIVVEY